MTRRTCHLAALVVFTAASVGVGAASHAAPDDTVTLSITGARGTRVHGQCLAETPEGERRLNLDAAVPVERRWRSDWLRCELETQGPVTVEAVGRGAHGRTSAGGGRVTIILG